MQEAWDALAGLEGPKQKGAPETHPGRGLYLSSAHPMLGGSVRDLMKCIGVPTDRLLLHPKACLRLPPAEVNVSLGLIDVQKPVKHFTPLSRPCRVRGRLTFILQLTKQSEGPSEMCLQKRVEE